MKKPLLIIGILLFWNLHSQVDSLRVHDDRLHFEIQVADSIVFHHESVMPYDFEVINDKKVVNTDSYQIDFTKATLYLLPSFYDIYNSDQTLHIYFKPFPDFLTNTHQLFDESNVFPNITAAQAVSFENKKQRTLKGVPFDGLETQGNIIRGVTVGNNQDAVLNSTLDLKIEGKLSPKITLSAHINDTNLPIQENGYSQELKDLDRVYIEMAAPSWNIKAGDVMLQDSTHYFLSFTKKIQGVAFETKTDDWNILASGALVKGRFAYQEFQGKEGNQGPYKLQGQNGELYIFIIQNSERVYINGIMQKKGQNNDYLMDYNTGEIIFTPTNPINSESRIYIEYQYSDRNFTRLITHNALNFTSKKLRTGIAFYKESDLKNQSLELNLTDQQKELLSQLDGLSNLIWTENAIETSYDPNKILYRKIINGTAYFFEYSENPTDVLYEVSFTYIGENKGDYQVLEYLALGKKMGYVGENQGDYKAIFPIHAPSSLQLTVLNADYSPNEKTDISIEMALSNKQNNLFANRKSVQNPAIKATWQQTLWKKKWKGTLINLFDFLNYNFKSPEKLFQVEFDRDWNLKEVSGNQTLFQTEFKMENEKHGNVNLQYEKLNFRNTYSGNRWLSNSNLHWNKWVWQHQISYLKSDDYINKTDFYRQFSKITFNHKKWWTSLDGRFEQNKTWNNTSQSLNANSFKTRSQNLVFGVGDTTKIYLKTGLQYIHNDSIKLIRFNHFYKSKSAWLQTQIIQNENTKLAIYSFVRKSDFVNTGKTTSYSNKINFSQHLWKQLLQFQTEYQTVSGQLAQQDYNYIETEPGQGYYTWIDYNANGIKELDEFEIAQYEDQANFLRISLPHFTYLPTQETKITQQLSINASKLKVKDGFFKALSHFHNQTQITAQNAKLKTENLISLNPYDTGNNTLHHNITFQNQLYFNQGKSSFTTGYIFNKSNQKLWQSFGSIYQDLNFHQLVFQHLIDEQWQIGFEGNLIENKSTNDSYFNRNFNIYSKGIKPNLMYFIKKNHWIKVAYQADDKKNSINEMEQLNAQKLILNYQYSGKKDTRFMVDFQLVRNDFIGEENSPVGYQMLEGLNSGKNATWSVLWTKKLNDFLYLNLNYNGRVNETSPVLHNGSVQMRAQF